MASAEPTFDFLDAPSQDGDVGTLGNYRVIRELGRGGMGFVFHAQDKRLQRDVALKVMNQKVAATPNSRKRFLHEARAMAAVHHDNVATIFEVGERSGTPFMAMEMLQGSTLEQFNRGGKRLDYDEIIRYAKEITQGLAAAHAKGIVHRDIKPANIWLESNTDRIKILDFGLALAATPVDQLAGRGAVIGTPGYLSPEQARTEPLDDRSDLYSLGVVLYELCTGQLPLHGKTVPAQLIAILAHRPRPIVELNPEIPAPLADLVHRLLFKEPRARVPSADALLRELSRVHTECHAKSEVAQTINKLQESLQKVVQKSAVVEPVVEPEVVEVLDPFAALPETPAVAVTSPAADPTAGAKSRVAQPAATLGTATAAPAYTRPQARKPAAAPTPAWQKYLIPASIVAVAVIALPIMVFVFSSMGGNSDPIVIAQNDPTADLNNEPNAGQTPDPDRPNQSRAATNRPNQAKPGQSGPNRKADKQTFGQTENHSQNQNASKNNGNRKRNPNRPSNAQPDPAARADKDRQPPPSGASTVAVTGSPTNHAFGSAGFKPTPEKTPIVDSSGEPRTALSGSQPETESSASVSNLQWTNISTADGRGADAMVQIGTTQKYGLKPSLAIHKRGKVESHHSYLRFDLASVEHVQEEVAGAEVILHLVGRNRPERANIRLHGLTLEGMPLWQEEGPRSLVWANTPSKVGLDSLPVLASATIGGDDDTGSKDTVRLASPELAAFIRSSPSDTVTFVLAGESSLSMPLRFVSREGASGKAPQLRVEAPPESSKKKDGRRGLEFR